MKYILEEGANHIKVVVKSVDSPTDLFSTLDSLLSDRHEQHCIADVTGLNINEPLAKAINNLLDKHRSLQRSIIFVTNAKDLSYFDEHAPVVPTLQEAIDFLEMEEIERKIINSEEE